MKNSFNILVFKFSKALGGGEKFTENICSEFIKRGHEVSLFSNYRPLIKRIRNISGLSIKRIYWGMEVGARRNIPEFIFLYPFFWLRFFLLLLTKKKRNRSNVVIFQNLNEKILASKIAKKLGYKVFWVEHLSIEPWLTRNFFCKKYIKESFFVDKIITVSDFVKKELTWKLKINSEKVVTIYNGLEIANYFVLPKEITNNQKKDLCIKKDDLVIGYLGRINKEKGIDLLIKSFSLVHQRINNSKLLIVGDGEEKNELMEITRKNNLESSVVFVDRVDNVNSVLNCMDVLVLPSNTRESFGLVLVEAMLLGKVVVGSNIGGIPEIIQDKKNGFLFYPGDINNLFNLLVNILKNDKIREEIGVVASKEARTRFSLSKMINNFEEIFEDDSRH